MKSSQRGAARVFCLAIFLMLALASGCSHYSNHSEPLVAVQIQDRNGVTETVSAPERLQAYEELDFFSSQPYKKVLRVYRKERKNHSIITSYHPNGMIAQYLEAEEMRAHGSYKEWFPNGQLRIDALVIGGTADITATAQKDWLFDGVNRVWDEQGHLIAQIPYQKGSLHGTSIYFYPSGLIQRQVTYVKNVEEGEAVEFYTNGNVKAKSLLSKGLKHGFAMGFFENKQSAWMEEYSEGLLLKGAYYNPQGECIAEVQDGRGKQILYDGDVLRVLIEIRQGAPEGMVKEFTAKRELQRCYSVKGNRKHGEEIEYFLPSETREKELRPKLSIEWESDTVHGIVKTWYSNGQLRSQREYCRNQKLGPSCAWYKNGSLMFVEEYEEGRLMKAAYYKKNQNEPISTITNGNGVSFLYDEDGIFLKKVFYAKGKPTDPEE